MTTSNTLFSIILSMDAYNRGYGAGVGGLSDAPGTTIGDATVKGFLENQADGFYGIAYTWGTQTVISYRGTDNLNVLDGANDILNGWVQGAGILSSQSQDAETFYQDVTGKSIFDGTQGNVLLTGHSLGGGLAGYIGSITGDRATIFDNMPFAQSAMNRVILQNIADGFTDFSGLFTGIATPPVDLPTGSSITSLYTSGEVLAAVRAAGPTLSAPFDAAFLTGAFIGVGVSPVAAAADAAAALVADTVIPFQETSLPTLDADSGSVFLGLSLSAVQLHSVSLMALLQYASDNGLTDWTSFGPQLIKAYFNDDLENAIGVLPGGAAGPAAQMLTEIAYSALDSGTMPFGDSGIRALFHDADALGQLYASGTVPSALNADDIKSDLANIAVEYAGNLARNSDTNASHDAGIISYSMSSASLAIDLSNASWTINGAQPSSIIGRDDLIQSLLTKMPEVPPFANVDDIVVATGDGGSTLNATSTLTSSQSALILGGVGDDTITGSSSDDLIVGGDGNDIIDGGAGADTAYFANSAIDYDITHNADGTWNINDVRGSGTDGDDTLTNVENVSFSDGQTYALQPDGILDQTDFSFVIDTTGSMAPYIGGVQDDADSLVNAIFGDGNTDAHISVVSFKDPQAGYPDQVVLPFTTETDLADRQEAAIDAINSLGADGGGDIPEGDYSGLLLALDGSAGEWRDSAAIRHIVLFTDAPVKDTDLQATVDQYAANLGVTIESHMVAAVAGKGQVDTFSFSASDSGARPFSAQIYTIRVGNDPTATASVQQIATDTGGQFFQSPTPADLIAALTQIISEIQISGTVAGQATDDATPIQPFADTSIVDPTSGQMESVTIVPSSALNGTFSNLGSGTVDPATGIYTITGTSSDVTNALQGLVFTPTPHQIAAGETVTTSFTITDTDTAGTTATDTVTSVVVTDTAPCFASGTRILTTCGEVAVEQLVVGDTVLTHFGGTAPILWLGQRTVDCRRHPHPQDVWPVRVTAGAFGAGKPVRDLLLSPDHAVFHDGVLTPIRYLINHATIVQERRDKVSYWHVELKNHNVLNAEGLACETYLDNGNRHAFSNCDSATQLHPHFNAGDGCQAIWESVACAPMRITGSAVAKLVMRLDRRVKKLGHAVSRHPANQVIHESAATVNLSALLQSNWYRATHTDVASADFDVGTHYAHWGWQEGRLPCPESDLIRALGLIDSGSLMFTMADVVMAGADPIAHFCSLGWREGRNPNPYFDTRWYLANNAVPSGMNPLLHYVLLGERQGFTPGPHFDPVWYREHYQLDAPVCGLAHYLLNRRTGIFSPLPSFDVKAYVREHTATLLQNRDPYAHHLVFGRSAPETNIEFSRLAA